MNGIPLFMGTDGHLVNQVETMQKKKNKNEQKQT